MRQLSRQGRTSLVRESPRARNRAVAIATLAAVFASLFSFMIAPAASAQAASPGAEYPATWSVTAHTASGTTPSGIAVTATLTGQAKFAGWSGLVISGSAPRPSYFPATTTGALVISVTDCANATPTGCGSITYTYSKPVMSPVLFTGDMGAMSYVRANPSTLESFHNSPQTLTSGGTFSLHAANSKTADLSIQNSGTTVGISDPKAKIGTATPTSSCNGFGCGAFDIRTTAPAVSSITIGLGYAGTGVNQDKFTQLIEATPFAPRLALTNTTPTALSTAGTPVKLSFAVANTGNTPVSNIHIEKTSFNGTGTLGPVTCAATTLAVGSTTSCSATYTTTQADADAGTVINTSTASGSVPGGAMTTSEPSSTRITTTSAPAIGLSSAATPSSESPHKVGQVIDYSFVATNTGNVTLTQVSVKASAAGSAIAPVITCPASARSLTPGASITCTAAHTLTQTDIDRGFSLTATAAGVPKTGSTPVSSASTVALTGVSAPSHPRDENSDRKIDRAASDSSPATALFSVTSPVSAAPSPAVTPPAVSASGPATPATTGAKLAYTGAEGAGPASAIAGLLLLIGGGIFLARYRHRRVQR